MSDFSEEVTSWAVSALLVVNIEQRVVPSAAGANAIDDIGSVKGAGVSF